MDATKFLGGADGVGKLPGVGVDSVAHLQARQNFTYTGMRVYRLVLGLSGPIVPAPASSCGAGRSKTPALHPAECYSIESVYAEPQSLLVSCVWLAALGGSLGLQTLCCLPSFAHTFSKIYFVS